jgi:2-dehydro-3-deoxyphosphooctonate aldolase (KDO 8-P synthase)
MFTPDKIFLIAGPCVLEDDALNVQIGLELARIAQEYDIRVIYKASFDKANRSKAGAARGPGLDAGIGQLALVKKETGLPVLSDVHESWQCAPVAEVCDALQIPAFLSRQTDLVVAAARTGVALNIKKGQWMAPEEMAGAVRKAREVQSQSLSPAQTIAVTERGTFLGYGDLVVDMRSFERMRAATNASVVFDGTHSVQRPGQSDGASGGDPQYIPMLVRAAIAAGADGLFIETHPHPETAPSDSTNMLRLDRLRPLLEQVLAIRQAIAQPQPPLHANA